MFPRSELALLTREEIRTSIEAAQSYDFCMLWNWEFDADFVALLETACKERGLSFLQVTPDNLERLLARLSNENLTFRVFFDRASDADGRFFPFADWARRHHATRINPFRLARRAWDKAKMNRMFTQNGLATPASIVLQPYSGHPDIAPPDLGCFGGRFAIKPSHGGGGRGVHAQGTSWEQVCAARREYPEDQYLLQAFVDPVQLGARSAWFRVVYFDGQIFPCWWDPHTHIYTPVSEAEEYRLSLQPLRAMTEKISDVCELELFSTEIALTCQGLFLVVDPVNDPIDLRLQSRTPDGLPDPIAGAIAEGLAELALNSI